MTMISRLHPSSLLEQPSGLEGDNYRTNTVMLVPEIRLSSIKPDFDILLPCTYLYLEWLQVWFIVLVQFAKNIDSKQMVLITRYGTRTWKILANLLYQLARRITQQLWRIGGGLQGYVLSRAINESGVFD